jgi:hypothetical protein
VVVGGGWCKGRLQIQTVEARLDPSFFSPDQWHPVSRHPEGALLLLLVLITPGRPSMTIPVAEQSLLGHAGHLNAAQEEAFEQLKKEVSQELASDPEPRWYDDTTLLYV